ncbi:MAG: hypothetical protein ACOYOK_03810 [Pseudobdellovibrionaceae bacterium]
MFLIKINKIYLILAASVLFFSACQTTEENNKSVSAANDPGTAAAAVPAEKNSVSGDRKPAADKPPICPKANASTFLRNVASMRVGDVPTGALLCVACVYEDEMNSNIPESIKSGFSERWLAFLAIGVSQYTQQPNRQRITPISSDSARTAFLQQLIKRVQAYGICRSGPLSKIRTDRKVSGFWSDKKILEYDLLAELINAKQGNTSNIQKREGELLKSAAPLLGLRNSDAIKKIFSDQGSFNQMSSTQRQDQSYESFIASAAGFSSSGEGVLTPDSDYSDEAAEMRRCANDINTLTVGDGIRPGNKYFQTNSEENKNLCKRMANYCGVNSAQACLLTPNNSSTGGGYGGQDPYLGTPPSVR